MGRVMAFDIGQKRVGVAVSDELRIIASPLETVPVEQIVPFLQDYLAKQSIDCLVVGEPKDMKGQDSDAARFIKPVVKKLKRSFPGLPVVSFDERFTSRMAFQAMLEGGLNRTGRRDKSMTDKISASIILRDYLEYEKNKQS